MKNRRGKYLYFCSAEQDSLYALTLFREKEKQGTLNVQETGLLLCMEQRAEDSNRNKENTSLKKEKIRFAIFYREAGDFSGSVCSSATG